MPLTPNEKRHYKAVERRFEAKLRELIALRDWRAVAGHFMWYGEFLRFNPESLESR